MPPTATGGANVSNDRSHPEVIHITSRPRRKSRLYLDYAALASLGKIVEITPKKITPQSDDALSAGQINVIPCKVVLERLSLANPRVGDFVDVTQPGPSAARTGSRLKSTVQSDLPPERFSNVTKRTKPRRTGGEANKEQVAAEKQRHTISIVEESHGSIIALDESTESGKVPRPRRTTQSNTTDVNGPPQVRRGTTRNKNITSDVVALDKELEVRSSTAPVQRKRGRPSLKHQNESIVPGCSNDSAPPVQRKRGRPSLKRQNESIVPGCSGDSAPPVPRKRGRPSLKRKNESIVPDQPGVSPPKRVLEHPGTIFELSVRSAEGTVEADAQPAVQVAETPPPIAGAVVSNQTTPQQHLGNPFKVVIVLVKRIVPALTEAGLKRLKYPELEAAPQEAKVSSVPAGVEKRPTTILPTRRPSRLTLSTKPQIVVSAPIAEDPEPAAPEPDRPKVDANSNNLLQPGVSGRRGAFNKKAPPTLKPPSSLPLLIEEEGEGSGDVYEFLSHSQTSGEGDASRKKRGRKPKQKGEKKNPVGRGAKKKPTAPRAATRKVNHHPFGCNGKQLARVLKKIGGGRVKSPTTTEGRYVVNLDLPASPREPASPVGQRHIIGGGGGEAMNDFPLEAPPSVQPLRAPNPAVERLKNGSSLVPPQTSTPLNKPALLATPETAPHNPASPWRLQDDTIVPRTAYMPRNKEMLPSYESLASEAENILPRTSSTVPLSLVTERRKPPPLGTSSVDTSSSSTASPPVRTSGDADFPGGIISEKNFREIERMYGELEATSELSRNLINSMRRYKATLASNPYSPPPDVQEYESNMRGACAKLRQWYERSMKSMNRSIRIINRMHQAINDRSAGRPPLLSTDQQRTVDTLSHSTDRFRTMIDELQEAMNDSNLENRSPPSASRKPAGGAVVATAAPSKPTVPLLAAAEKPAEQPTQVGMNDSNVENRSPPPSASTKPAGDAVVVATVSQSKPLPLPTTVVKPQQPTQVTDVIELPNRTNGVLRKPLMVLNFVPLPQRSSTLMSPLARTDGPAIPLAKAATNLLPDQGENVRRELQYDRNANSETKETMASSSTVTIVEPPASVESDEPDVPNESIPAELVPEVGANEVVEVCDETTMDNDLHRSDEQPDDDDAAAASNRDSHCTEKTADGDQARDFFGFEEESAIESSQLERTQVTLPMPLNISAETLRCRLKRAKQLIPKQAIFRKQVPNGAAAPSGRSSGPTRFPVNHLRVFSSPTKRPHTLREFIASTPRSDMSLLAVPKRGPQGLTGSSAPPLDAPDVSAIAGNETVVEEQDDQCREEVPDVVLFGTPEESKINRSAHQRTYARIPRRRKKINIYLANVGLDDDDDEDEDDDNPAELSSDSESEETKRRKKKAAKKKPRRKPTPVVETKEYKEFVETFNSMCESVDRFPVIIE